MLMQGENTSQNETPSHRGKKGAVAVWLFILLYWALTSFFEHVEPASKVPSLMTASLWLTFIAGQFVEYAPVLLFLFLFVWMYEARASS
jgi:hypothetical protein